MQWFEYPKESEWEAIMARPKKDSKELMGTIASVFNDVQTKGDQALRDYTERYDGVRIGEILVDPTEIANAEAELGTNLKTAIKTAYKNIALFHKSQTKTENPIETMSGVTCWRKSLAISKVGLYVPGGTAPLFSTVLMLAIPAVIAGCEEIILCSPPDQNGAIHPAILYAAHLCGVDKIARIGGSQAVAAMTLGTASIPRVDKLFGPGNQYVTAAKLYAQSQGTAIDMPAGPSEVLVVTDESSYPEFVAADLLSQAEHGPDSQVICVGTNAKILEDVQEFVKIQLADLPRKEMAQKSLDNSSIVLLEEFQVMDFVNQYAPEHLILATDNAEELATQVKNAGSVFIGHLTPEAVGDYASGTNHTLPTSGYARAYSGVSVDSFIKKVTFQRVTEEGLKEIGPVVEEMAAAEHLDAHKQAISLRLKAIDR